MVVPHQAGTTKTTARAARLAPHEKLTARIAPGLEPALIDNEMVTIVSFEADDARTFGLRVAGPAALLVAKVIKISERLDQADKQPDRLKEKDALDAFRLLQAIETDVLADGLRVHLDDEHASSATAKAIEQLRHHGASRDSRLAVLASEAASGDPAIPPAFAALVTDLLGSL